MLSQDQIGNIQHESPNNHHLKDTESTESLNYLFHISDVDTSIDRKTRFKNLLKKRLGLLEELTPGEFDLIVKKICSCCLKQIKDLHELHLKRTSAMEMLNDLIPRMNSSYIKTHHVVHLVWSIMSCMHHFQLRFRSGSKFMISWTRKKKVRECMDTYTGGQQIWGTFGFLTHPNFDRRKKARECMDTYIRLIKTFHYSTYRIVLNSLIIFYKEGKLWTIEFRVTEMILELLYLYGDIEEALEDILTTAELSSLTSEIEPRMLMKVLYEVLGMVRWDHMSEEMLRRFLVMWRKSISPNIENIFRYSYMRNGLNLCLRNITKHLSNTDLMSMISIIVEKITFREMENEALLEFGSIAEYAALRYHTERFGESIPEELMNNLKIMMVSDYAYHHLFAYRIKQNIMDRNFNRLIFETPRIFFKGVSYNIKIAKYSARDRLYFKEHRYSIYRALITGLQYHYDRKINLENVFSYLAITCVEIPCSYVAASIVSFAMAMQEYILQANPPNMEACHHVHSVVMSLMSLVCYVHKAEVFYNYVSLIMERRSDMAPHLNPPNTVKYNYAQHHILWNKPDLFFEDWEARYGLWKCFRTTEEKKSKNTNRKELGGAGDIAI